MNKYSNPTANKAIGSVDGEIRRAQETAKRLRERLENGQKIDRQLEKARKRYVGLFRLAFERELVKPPEEQENDTEA